MHTHFVLCNPFPFAFCMHSLRVTFVKEFLVFSFINLELRYFFYPISPSAFCEKVETSNMNEKKDEVVYEIVYSVLKYLEDCRQ